MTLGRQPFRSIRTFSESWMQLHRDTHSQRPEFGTHHHPYLHELIAKLAAELTADERPSLLDYGCGKGAFLREMDRSGLFRFTRGCPTGPASPRCNGERAAESGLDRSHEGRWRPERRGEAPGRPVGIDAAPTAELAEEV
jgi:hypothetical protein